jgi:PAS domain-containing protein
LKKYLNYLSNIGTDPDLARIEQREVILCNKLTLLMIPISIIAMIVSFYIGIISAFTSFFVLLIFLGVAFWLNRYRINLLARLVLSIVPSIALIYPFIIGDIVQVNNYSSVSYILIGLTIIPIVLFNKKSERFLIAVNIVFHLAIITYFNYLTLGMGESIFLMLIPQVVLLVLMISAFQFLKRESYLVENDLKETNKALTNSNIEIESMKEEINAQNDYLNSKQLKIEEQAANLIKTNTELTNTKTELVKLIDKLQEAKEKLIQKEAEAKSILNALNDHYLVAQYDLSGQLVDINSKVTELFGSLKPDLNMVKAIANPDSSEVTGGEKITFKRLWPKIINGGALTLDIEIPIGNKSKFFSTTLAPLFDPKGDPYRILAIGQDITELIDNKDKVNKINDKLNEKIHEISDQNQLLNHQQLEIFNQSEALKLQSEEIKSINESLEERVRERTQVLEEKNKQLAEYAFINSHVLRAPVSTMLGLINLISYSSIPVEDQKIYDHLLETAKILDTIIYKINHAIENGSHFDRTYLEPERDFQPVK